MPTARHWGQSIGGASACTMGNRQEGRQGAALIFEGFRLGRPRGILLTGEILERCEEVRYRCTPPNDVTAA